MWSVTVNLLYHCFLGVGSLWNAAKLFNTADVSPIKVFTTFIHMTTPGGSDKGFSALSGARKAQA